MNDSSRQQRFKFHDYDTIVIAIILFVFIEYCFHWHLFRYALTDFKGHFDWWSVPLFLLEAYFCWQSIKSVKNPIVLSDKGIKLPKYADEDGEGLEIGWNKIYRVSLINNKPSSKNGWNIEDKTIQLQVRTVSKAVYTFDVFHYLNFRKNRFIERFEQCSGKRLGEIITPKTCKSLGNYEVEEREGLEGVVDTDTGKVVLPFEYEYIDGLALEEKDELICVNKGLSYGFVNTSTWAVSIPIMYSDVCSFREGLAAVEYEEGKWHFVDRNNNIVIAGPFEQGGEFSEGLCAVMKGGKYGFIDKQGKAVIPFQYNGAGNFSEGLAAAGMKDSDGNVRYGYIDKSGNTVIGFQYQNAQELSEHLAAVQSGKLWGYINKKGETVIPPKYHDAYPFENGKAEVTTKGFLGTKLGRKTFSIDSKGNKAK